MKTQIKDSSVNGFPEHSATSTKVTLLLNLGKHQKNLYSSHCLLSKRHFKLLKFSIACFPQFKLKCAVFFLSYDFPRTPNPQRGQHTLQFNTKL
jgi:hypothetical protein